MWVHDGDFSYIQVTVFMSVSSKDFYTERDWNRVVNKEVIFTFNKNL